MGDVNDLEHWCSITIMSRAEHTTKQREIDRIIEFIKMQNLALSPDINRTSVDTWGCVEVMALYRIHPTEMAGRTTDRLSSQ